MICIKKSEGVSLDNAVHVTVHADSAFVDHCTCGCAMVTVISNIIGGKKNRPTDGCIGALTGPVILFFKFYLHVFPGYFPPINVFYIIK